MRVILTFGGHHNEDYCSKYSGESFHVNSFYILSERKVFDSRKIQFQIKIKAEDGKTHLTIFQHVAIS